jgi:hypothetical protein
VDAHTIALAAAGETGAARAIWRHAADAPGMTMQAQAIMAWARATRSPGAPILATPPFAPGEAPEFIGTAVTFHYLNRMVSAVLSPTFLPRSPWLRGAFRQLAARMYSPTARRTYPPGSSLALLPEAPLPGDLAWAEPMPAIAGAFARFAAAVERAGAEVLAPEVRALVADRVRAWAGEEPGLSRQWAMEAARGLDAPAQAAARLALLAALAPYQIEADVIAAFRAHQPTDSELIGALAWASFAAARRFGTWLVTDAGATVPTVRCS